MVKSYSMEQESKWTLNWDCCGVTGQWLWNIQLLQLICCPSAMQLLPCSSCVWWRNHCITPSVWSSGGSVILRSELKLSDFFICTCINHTATALLEMSGSSQSLHHFSLCIFSDYWSVLTMCSANVINTASYRISKSLVSQLFWNIINFKLFLVYWCFAVSSHSMDILKLPFLIILSHLSMFYCCSQATLYWICRWFV